MNFKIENRSLNLRNYPSVESHLEDMAARGWMIDKIILENIFIYKKIKAKKLDFSIVPYQTESFLNKKNKEEIELYKDENLEKGWHYAAKTRNIQIYYKEKDTDAIAIIADEADEFRRIEEASKFVMLGNYLSLPLLLFLFWGLAKDIGTDISIIKSGLVQLLIFFFPFIMISIISEIVSTELFLKKNRKHIYDEEKMEYSTSKYHFSNLAFIMSYIFIFLFLVYIIYTTLFLKDTRALFSMAPVTIGLIVGTGLRFFGKSSKIKSDYKPIIFIGVIVLTLIMMNIIFFPLIFESEREDQVDRDKYRVMMIDDFFDGVDTDSRELSNDVSLLAPRSYEYVEMDRRNIYLRTDYSRALNEDIAHNLVKRYICQAERQMEWWYDYDLDNYYYNDNLRGIEGRGIREDELKRLKEEFDSNEELFKIEARKIIKERMIRKTDPSLWNADEAYYLEYEKDVILLRRGEEVWQLGGVDFSDEEIRSTVMEKLKLN